LIQRKISAEGLRKSEGPREGVSPGQSTMTAQEHQAIDKP
jgi:hypothetical protein